MSSVGSRLLGEAALVVAAGSCDQNPSVMVPRGSEAVSAEAVSSQAGEIACAALEVDLHGNDLDHVGVTPVVGDRCGAALQLLLAAPAEFDARKNVVRLPIALRNSGADAVQVPAGIYGWEDSLVVTSPPGLARNKHTASYLTFANPDFVVPAGVEAFAGAVVWKLDALLADADGNPGLPADATSQPAWIEITVKRGVHQFVVSLEAAATVAAVPAAPILFVTDTGVVGPALIIDSTANVGARVPYAFVAEDGFTNVQVRLDGVRAPASGTILADTAGHVLTATADRVITIPDRAEGIYAAAQAVLTATDVPAAFQAYLDADYAYLQPAPNQDQALQDIGDVEALAFDFLTHQAALRHVDSALAGYSFRLGPDSLGDPGGSPIINPGDTGVVERNRVPVALSSFPERDLVSRDTIEPTTFVYMNGIWTNEARTADAWTLLSSVIRLVPGFRSRNIGGRYHYNRTFSDQMPTPEDQRIDCEMNLGMALANGRYGLNAAPDFMAMCMEDSTLWYLSDLDLVEAIRQAININLGRDAPEVDAIALANDLQRDRDAGRHVILVAHSEGNLMAVQAIGFLKQHGKYHGLLDPTCLGVVALASPVDPSHFAVPDHRRASIVVDGDLVPDLAGNFSTPRTSTVLSRFVDRTTSALLPAHPVQALLIRTVAGFSALHYVTSSYLQYEAADLVKADLVKVYGGCTVHGLQATQPELTVTRGSRFIVPMTYLSAFGDALNRPVTASQWTIAQPSILGPNGVGIFRALTSGSTTITATYGAHAASALVHVAEPAPSAIVGHWLGTWLADTYPDGGTMEMTITGDIFGMSATVTWTDALGQVWHAASTTSSENRIVESSGSSFAEFRAGFKKPSDPNGYTFFRFFTLLNRAGTNTASGSAFTGSGIDGGTYTLTRVTP